MPNIKNQKPNAQGIYPSGEPTKPTRTSDSWVKELNELKSYADSGRFAAWTRWNEAWRLYNNQYDYSTKAKWQAKNFIPKISMTVEMAASLVRRAMLDANEWFRYEGTSETSRAMAPYLEKIAYWYLDQLRFVDRFVPPMKGGFVGSLIVLKPHLAPYVLANETEEDVERRLRGEKVEREVMEGPAITVSYPDPYDIWLDPSGRGLFVIEEEEMDFSTAWDLVDMGVFDGDVLDKINEDWTESDKAMYANQRREMTGEFSAKPTFRTELKLTHFWGSLPTKRGRWAIQNGHYVIANEKYLLRKPMDNPYTHKKIPYIIGSPFRRPFSVYHKGLIEDVVGLQKGMTELLNLTLDSTLFAGIKAFEVDLDQIEDPQQILNGIYPGKVFTARKGGQNTQMIRDIQISGVAKDVVGVYQMLNNEYQNQTAVTEFISGAQGTATNRTATEVVTKQQQGMGIFSEIARNLEGTVLEPLLEQMASLIVEHHDNFLTPKMVEILGFERAAELAMIGPDGRLDKFDPTAIRVRASGLTALLNRTEELQKIGSLMQNLGQFGQMLPLMLADIDAGFFFKNVFRRMVRAFGWNENDLIKEKTEAEKAAEQAAAAAAAAGPSGPAGTSPPGASPQPNQPAAPGAGQIPGQIAAIQQRISGGGVAPSPQGG